MPNLPNIPLSDIAALVWFVVVWFGYTWYTDHGKPRAYSLRSAMHKNRYRWMEQVLKRDNRMVDVHILAQLGQGTSFFASASLLILVGLFTLVGSTDEAMGMLKRIPFASKTTLAQWELKLLVLIVIFVHAFFKFTWGLRQFNYCAVLVGSAPVDVNSNDTEFVRRTAWISTLASKDFNQGLRAYYFGLAVLAWFASVWAFVAVTTLILGVLFWREYHSEALRTLEVPSDTSAGDIYAGRHG
jgi:uncharacterized membrane protein